MSTLASHVTRLPYALTDMEWDVQSVRPATTHNASLSESTFRKVVDEPAQAVKPSFGPRWLAPTVDRLEHLLQLQNDWDSYGSVQILFENAEYAVRLLDFVMTPTAPAPFIAPTSGGSLQLEWHRRDLDLEIEILSPYNVFVSYEDLTGTTTSWEAQITVDLTKVREAIHELSRRM